jgi:hypothetical protein
VGGQGRQLPSQHRAHRTISIEGVDHDAALCDLQRNPPCASAQLQNGPPALPRLCAVPLGIAAKRRRCHEVIKIRMIQGGPIILVQVVAVISGPAR